MPRAVARRQWSRAVAGKTVSCWLDERQAELYRT